MRAICISMQANETDTPLITFIMNKFAMPNLDVTLTMFTLFLN